MKTVFKLIVCFFICSFYNCASDDDSNNTDEVALEGVWRLSSLSIESEFDFNNDGTPSSNMFEETPCYDNDFINFSADGTVNVVTALTSITIEFSSPSEYGHVYECQNGFDQVSTWTRDGNIITVENGSTDLVGEINGNRITVFIENFFQIENYDGMEYSYPQEDVVLVYVKQ